MTDAGALEIIYVISVVLLFFQRTQKAQPEHSFRLGFERWSWQVGGSDQKILLNYGMISILSWRFEKVFRFLNIWFFAVKRVVICEEIRQKHRFLGAFVRDIFFVLYRWSWWWESNPQPSHYEWDALPLSHISNLFFPFYHESTLPSSTERGKHGNDGERSAWCRMKALPKSGVKAYKFT